MTSTSTPSSGARWKMFILACEMARVPLRSHDHPFRACRMFTPRSKPSRLTLMNSDVGRGSLKPRRGHPAAAVPDGGEPLPVAGVTPDDPVFDSLTDGGFVRFHG